MARTHAITLTASDFSAVTLVGGGPGDADLITVAGLKALLAADVVVTDRLAPRALLAELDPSIEVVDVAKVPGSRFTAQEEINELLFERSLSGKNVVRLKGGDGYVFGRGFEELLALQEVGSRSVSSPGSLAVENAGAIAAALMNGGRSVDTPAAVICDGSLPTERTITSSLGGLGSDIADENIKPPAIIVIGDVVTLAG